jgi:hypothetical protein
MATTVFELNSCMVRKIESDRQPHTDTAAIETSPPAYQGAPGSPGWVCELTWRLLWTLGVLKSGTPRRRPISVYSSPTETFNRNRSWQGFMR